MKNIKILDCTLRDGGYINNWKFDKADAKNIVKLLLKSNIDFIETGFLTNKKSKEFNTLFNNFSDIESILFKKSKEKYLVMLNYNDFDINKIPNKKETLLEGIRLIFKKENHKNALIDAEKIKEKGYKLFINPTYINTYNKKEIVELIKAVNKINPYCFTIVDTLGVLEKKDIINISKTINELLDEKILLGFHSHDNKQLAFLNCLYLIENIKNRTIIIDSSVFSMGRGAGNIQSELLAKYLNDNYNSNYNLNELLKIVDKYIRPIFYKTPWGYSMPYQLCAINKCHTNYAKYLIEKNIISSEKIDLILQKIPKDKRLNFDKKVINDILRYC